MKKLGFYLFMEKAEKENREKEELERESNKENYSDFNYSLGADPGHRREK